ncbi:MAG: adenylyltransferase/riboflavin kinase [Chthonomonadaceae bacterium]|nr:adenylyltransferase/riboflavin kinase [Chthonomonadaceae bacterium]
MKVYEGLEAIPAPLASSSVAIGTFDGVHRGHQALIRRAVEDAHAQNRPAVVLTFDRHPMELFRPEAAPKRLTTPAQRDALIAALGIDTLIVARFDHALAELSADAFMTEILKGLLGAQAIVEGDDFCFGKGRAGDLAYLQHRQGKYCFTLHTLKPLLIDGVRASSTRVRELLHAGEIAHAEEMLGHGYWLAGQAIRTQRSRHVLRHATVHLIYPYRQVIPLEGAYSVRIRFDDGRECDGICTIRKAVNPCLETVLSDFDANLTGREMTLRFVHRLHAEGKRYFLPRDAAVRDIA